MKSSVSVITFAFVSQENGRGQLLDECLASVASQKYGDYEHIVIDDGSTVDISTMVGHFPNTKLVRKEQSGILTNTATFNAGHIIAANKYCIYLASDDLQTANCLSALTKFLDDNQRCVAVCGAAEYIDIEQNITQYKPDWADNNPADLANSLVYQGNKVSGCAVMWRNNSLDKETSLPPNITGFCSDYDLWVRLAEAGQIGRCAENVVQYRAKQDSTRFKTRGSDISSPHKFDHKFFQFSKFARIRYVKNSALKRRMRQKFVKAPFLDPLKADTEALLVFADGESYEVKATRESNDDILEKAGKYLKGNAWHSDRNPNLLALLKSLCADFDLIEPRLNEPDIAAMMKFGSPLAALLGSFITPQASVLLDMNSFDAARIQWIDYFNWALVDNYISDNINSMNEDLRWMGLIPDSVD